MPKWTEYTSKDTLADNDEVMLYDATAKANKRGLMSKFWDYVVDKMATAVISKLETDNKTIIGAINALNGKTTTIVNTKRFDSDTDFHNIPDGLYSFNTNTPSTNSEYMLPPIEKIGDGILIAKTYSKYQTICCIGYKGIAVIQKDTSTNKFLTDTWNILIKL